MPHFKCKLSVYKPPYWRTWNSVSILYEIGYREYYPEEGPWRSTKPRPNDTSHLIDSLTYKVTYEFRIEAINDYGIGPWSTSIFLAIELGTKLCYKQVT